LVPSLQGPEVARLFLAEPGVGQVVDFEPPVLAAILAPEADPLQGVASLALPGG
jgi:hypothetical protein